MAWTGGNYGLPAARPTWLDGPLVRQVPFCPEDHRMGTPRRMPDLHDGDGLAVLDGRARMLDDLGNDVTPQNLAGAQAMVELASEHEVDFAVLVDRSGACGSQVVSLGCRFEEPVQHVRGVGVASAALLRAAVHIVSQRDFQTLGLLGARLGHPFDPSWLDHHEHPWVVENLPRQ
ncbi:MAG: DUF523 domain-containing protein [Proteobacteria bacterium]|nr:DUF523 domain-containing protein [Pseudomonadota bacterium]MCP4922170.1 DUF523 domain-containing protein [Pseudomonadota bacterium]